MRVEKPFAWATAISVFSTILGTAMAKPFQAFCPEALQWLSSLPRPAHVAEFGPRADMIYMFKLRVKTLSNYIESSNVNARISALMGSVPLVCKWQRGGREFQHPAGIEPIQCDSP